MPPKKAAGGTTKAATSGKSTSKTPAKPTKSTGSSSRGGGASSSGNSRSTKPSSTSSSAGAATPKGKSSIELPRTQRKISHLLDSSGSGDSFRYYNKLARKSGFILDEAVYLTEKWDGTTVQATRSGVFKRVDLMRKGDPRKHSAPEHERYRLEHLDLDHAKNQYISRAVAQYRDIFEQLPSGLCVYFEAIGTNIGSRFKDIGETDLYDIRVFDFARSGEFVSFDETIALANEYSLPLVHYEELDKLQVSSIVEVLSSDKRYYDIEAPLEGFVVRDVTDRGRIAKIRVEDLSKMAEAHY